MMTPKVTKLTNKGYDLALEMSSGEGIKYERLLKFLGTPVAVYDFLNAIAQLVDNMTDAGMKSGSRFSDNWPWLTQSAEEGEEWEGQPVVCDGWFNMVDGELWFSGSRFTHGSGGPVSRKVMPHDYILWYRCNSIQSYVKGVHYA